VSSQDSVYYQTVAFMLFKTLQHLHSHKYSLFLYKHNDSHSYQDNNFDLVIIITSQLLFLDLFTK